MERFRGIIPKSVQGATLPLIKPISIRVRPEMIIRKSSAVGFIIYIVPAELMPTVDQDDWWENIRAEYNKLGCLPTSSYPSY